MEVPHPSVGPCGDDFPSSCLPCRCSNHSVVTGVWQPLNFNRQPMSCLLLYALAPQQEDTSSHSVSSSHTSCRVNIWLAVTTTEVSSFLVLCFLPRNAYFSPTGWMQGDTSEGCSKGLTAPCPVRFNRKVVSSLKWWHGLVIFTVWVSLQEMVMPLWMKRMKRKERPLGVSSWTRMGTRPRRSTEAQPPWKPHAPGCCLYPRGVAHTPGGLREGWGVRLLHSDRLWYKHLSHSFEVVL